jgi:hypothetical protein
MNAAIRMRVDVVRGSLNLSGLIRNRCFQFIEASLLFRSSDVSVAWEVVRDFHACNYNTRLALRKDLGAGATPAECISYIVP